MILRFKKSLDGYHKKVTNYHHVHIEVFQETGKFFSNFALQYKNIKFLYVEYCCVSDRMNLYCDYEEDEGNRSEISIYESRKVVELVFERSTFLYINHWSQLEILIIFFKLLFFQFGSNLIICHLYSCTIIITIISIIHHLSSINHHPSTFIHLPSTFIHNPSTIIHQPSSINHHPSTTFIHNPSTIIHQPSTINHQVLFFSIRIKLNNLSSLFHLLLLLLLFPSFIIHHPSTIIHHSSTIIHQPSSIIHQTSSIIHQLSSINHHQSSIINQ